MSTRAISRRMGAAALAVAAMAMLGWSHGSPPSRIGGTFSLKYAEQHPLAVPDAEGHVLLMGRVEGRNRSTGPVTYMDQAEVTNLEFADLAQGNGPQQGYISMRQGADTVISSWKGKVTTTLSPEKTPITTFEGTWNKVKGTGRYQGITGSGTYKGRFTSKNEYTVDWNGQLAGGPLAEK